MDSRISEQNLWIKANEQLPDFNKPVVAWLSGRKFHSDLTWQRDGYAFLVRHDDDKYSHTDARWGINWFNAALKKIDADEAEVTHWFYVPGEPS